VAKGRNGQRFHCEETVRKAFEREKRETYFRIKPENWEGKKHRPSGQKGRGREYSLQGYRLTREPVVGPLRPAHRRRSEERFRWFSFGGSGVSIPDLSGTARFPELLM